MGQIRWFSNQTPVIIVVTVFSRSRCSSGRVKGMVVIWCLTNLEVVVVIIIIAVIGVK